MSIKSTKDKDRLEKKSVVFKMDWHDSVLYSILRGYFKIRWRHRLGGEWGGFSKQSGSFKHLLDLRSPLLFLKTSPNGNRGSKLEFTGWRKPLRSITVRVVWLTFYTSRFKRTPHRSDQQKKLKSKEAQTDPYTLADRSEEAMISPFLAEGGWQDS